MQNNIKPLRANMRKVVTTFEGEEMFIVPKNGGFGQVDNEEYVMVAGKTEVSDTPTKPVFTPAPKPVTPVASTPKPVTPVASTPKPVTPVASTPKPVTPVASTPKPVTPVASTPKPVTPVASTPKPVTPVASTPAPTPRPATTTTPVASTPRPASTTTTTPRPVSESTIPRSTTTPTTSTTTPRSTTTPTTGTTTPLPTFPNFNNLSREELHAQIMSLGRMRFDTTKYTPAQIQVLNSTHSQALALYNSKFGTTTPKTTTTPVMLPTFSNVATMSCDGLTAEITRIENIMKTSKFSSVQIADAYNKQLASAKTQFNSKCNRQPATPTPVTLPTFPNFATLSCDNLRVEIKKIETTMSTSRFGSAQVTDAYTKALATAKQVLASKCSTPSPAPVPMPTPIPDIPKEEKKEETPAPVGGGGGGAIGGGGGGGAMEEGLGEQPVAEGELPIEEKKSYSWLWLLLIVGGIYVATRK